MLQQMHVWRSVHSPNRGGIRNLSTPWSSPFKPQGIPEQDMILYSDMADGFDAHCKRQGLRQKTINSALQRVMDMLNYVGQAPWFWTLPDFDRYSRHLTDDREIKRSTLRKYQGEICRFHDYIRQSVAYRQQVRSRYRVEIADLSSVEHATHKEEEEGVGARAMTPEEIDVFFDTIWKLIDQAEAKREAGVKNGVMAWHRDYALFTAFYHYGLRLHEGAGLRISKFSQDPDKPEYGIFGIVQVLGKASKGSEKPKRSIPMTFPNTHLILQPYMATVRPYFLANVDPSLHQDGVRVVDFMFLSERGAPLSKNTIWSRFEQIKRAAGLEDERISPHSLRKSFATHNYMRGLPLDTLRRLLGHKHLSTTQIYLDLSETHVKDDIRRIQGTAIDNATK